MSSQPLNLTVKTPGGSLKMVGKVSHAINETEFIPTIKNIYKYFKAKCNKI